MNGLHSSVTNGLLQADISFVIEEKGQPSLSHKADRPMIPASNMKLLISAAALLSDKELLPPLHTSASGELFSGTLHGDLILDSCGSPIFSARFPVNRSIQEKNEVLDDQVKAYVKKLKEIGITQITGDLKISFDRWQERGENNHYCPSAAFSFNENTLDTVIQDGHFLSCPKHPHFFDVTVNNTIPSQDNVKGNLIRYNPTVDSRDYWRLSQNSAIEYSRLMLKQYFSRHGLKFHEQQQPPQQKYFLFATDCLESLTSFIQPMNCWSDNYRAEILALQLSRAYSGRAVYKQLSSALSTVFKQNKLELSSFTAVDGSGLSRENRVTARDLNKLLKFMSQSHRYTDYKSSLAIAGKRGTLKRRFKDTVFENSFFGKTGTLNGVSALSGYWLRDNKPLVTMTFIGNEIDKHVFWQTLDRLVAKQA